APPPQMRSHSACLAMRSSSWCAGRRGRAIGWCTCSRRSASRASSTSRRRAPLGALMRGTASLALTLLLAAAQLDAPAEAATPAATAQPLPVIIDTDIGDDIDDAFALTLALLDPRLEVIGVTTAWGDTRTRTLLFRLLLASLGPTDVV